MTILFYLVLASIVCTVLTVVAALTDGGDDE